MDIQFAHVMCVFHLLKNMFVFSPVGFEGNLITIGNSFIFSGGLNQMEGVIWILAYAYVHVCIKNSFVFLITSLI